ncbi:hypothetical protein HGA64_05030 [Candidatus Falkowbacteria bacterium]|nr:hypothetical protein [Candidatus Falkowbacteria bacterium]
MFQAATSLDDLEIAIIKTISFFDVLDWPLTADEVRKNLWRKRSSLIEVEQALVRLNGKIESLEGFYFLPGRQVLVAERKKAYIRSWHKIKAAMRITKLLRYVPGVRLVAICNSVAIGNLKPQSDIDLFVITARRRIWLTRLLVTAVVQASGLRRHGKLVRNRVCLSFYVSEEDMGLKKVTLESDPYFCYWLASLFVIYDFADSASKLRESNGWLYDNLPNASEVRPARRLTVNNYIANRLGDKLISSALFDVFESWSRFFQLKKMHKNKPNHQAQGTAVVISDTMLKFHEEDRREYFASEWQGRINMVIPGYEKQI